MTIAGHIRRAIAAASHGNHPYPHWTLRQVLPVPLADALIALPIAPPAIDDTQGRRETHNTSRIFVSAESRAAFPACADLADTFQAPPTIALLEQTCGRSLAGTSLRIEYCLDTNGFWLEPHTDIGAKLFTMLIYLSQHPDAEHWGTDILDPHGTLVTRSSGAFNTGLIFLPAADTWHGFAPRPIAGIRRSLIVNYVAPEWRARHELAFPAMAVRAG